MGYSWNGSRGFGVADAAAGPRRHSLLIVKHEQSRGYERTAFSKRLESREGFGQIPSPSQGVLSSSSLIGHLVSLTSLKHISRAEKIWVLLGTSDEQASRPHSNRGKFDEDR